MAPCGPLKSHKSLLMKEMLVGAVGIELKAMLKTRKLLILVNDKNSKNTRFAEMRYTLGTRATQQQKEVRGERHHSICRMVRTPPSRTARRCRQGSERSRNHGGR
jgi:hypothetical protein